jgi:hypothetical protein
MGQVKEIGKRRSETHFLSSPFSLQCDLQLYRNGEKTNLHHYETHFFALQSLDNDIYVIFRHGAAEVGQKHHLFHRKLLSSENN